MAKEPQMLEGMRAPQSVRLEEMRKAAETAEAERHVPAAGNAPVDEVGPTVYVSRFSKYRIQVAAAPDITDPFTGRRQPGRLVVAEFDNGIYRNNAKDKETRKLIDQALQENAFFGKFGGGENVHFWLQSEQSMAVSKRKMEDALATLKAMPKEAVEQFMSSLKHGTADDHTLSAV